MQDLHVAGVGRLAVEQVVAERRAPEHLGDERVLEQRQAHAAVRAGQLRRPQPELLDALAQPVGAPGKSARKLP